MTRKATTRKLVAKRPARSTITVRADLVLELDRMLRDLFVLADAAGEMAVVGRLGRVIARAERLRQKIASLPDLPVEPQER